MMFRSKLVKGFLLGLGLSVVFSAAAFAEVDSDQEVKIQIEQVGAGTDAVIGLAPDTPVSSDGNTSSISNPVSEAMYQKQAEIDKLLFEKHKEEISDKGITVTHTNAVKEHVEVGITPFSEDHAAYIRQLLGDDKVKVVEGFRAIPYSDGAAGEELMYATGAPVDEVLEGGVPVEDADILLAEDDVKVVSSTVETVSAPVNETLSAATIVGIAAAALVALGGILVVMKRMKVAG